MYVPASVAAYMQTKWRTHTRFLPTRLPTYPLMNEAMSACLCSYQGATNDDKNHTRVRIKAESISLTDLLTNSSPRRVQQDTAYFLRHNRPSHPSPLPSSPTHHHQARNPTIHDRQFRNTS